MVPRAIDSGRSERWNSTESTLPAGFAETSPTEPATNSGPLAGVSRANMHQLPSCRLNAATPAVSVAAGVIRSAAFELSRPNALTNTPRTGAPVESATPTATERSGAAGAVGDVEDLLQPANDAATSRAEVTLARRASWGDTGDLIRPWTNGPLHGFRRRRKPMPDRWSGTRPGTAGRQRDRGRVDRVAGRRHADVEEPGLEPLMLRDSRPASGRQARQHVGSVRAGQDGRREELADAHDRLLVVGLTGERDLAPGERLRSHDEPEHHGVHAAHGMLRDLSRGAGDRHARDRRDARVHAPATIVEHEAGDTGGVRGLGGDGGLAREVQARRGHVRARDARAGRILDGHRDLATGRRRGRGLRGGGGLAAAREDRGT